MYSSLRKTKFGKGLASRVSIETAITAVRSWMAKTAEEPFVIIEPLSSNQALQLSAYEEVCGRDATAIFQKEMDQLPEVMPAPMFLRGRKLATDVPHNVQPF